VIVESVQLVEGNLLLAGHTGALAQESYQPVGPIHQFVSYRPADHRNRQDARLSSRRNSSADEKLR
jgi:hypothetical protein